MNRTLWVLGAILVATILAVAVARAPASRADASALGDEYVRVTRRDMGSVVKATGVIRPRVGAEVRVGSRISGVVKRLHVQIGDSVRKGQLLAELDARDLEARRDEAGAELARLEVDLAYSRSDLRRKRALREAGAITPSDLEAAERVVATTERQVDAARAKLTFAAAQLGYTKVVAPIDGVVSSVSTQEGETIAAGFAAPTFLTLLDPSRLEVWAYVDETDIGRIRTGQSATFTVDTYGEHEFRGRVAAIYPAAEIRDNVVNYVAVVRFAHSRDRILRPEMTTTVRVGIDARRGVLAVPTRAIRWLDGRAFVLVRTASGTERHVVTIGFRDEGFTELVDGVHEGDELLVGNEANVAPQQATSDTGEIR